MSSTPLPRPAALAPARARHRAARRTASGVVLGAVALLPAGAAWAAPAATEPTGPCTDEQGVTVVVDKTDVGGEVEIGCAEGATTGTEALQAAGFTDTRDDAGMICAIDDLPDPCPTTFEGSFWSYWHAEPDGEWETYMVGSDEAEPEPGSVEGWRYHDGSEGPTVAPPVPGEPSPESSPESSDEAPSAEPTQDEATTDEPTADPAEDGTDAQDEAADEAAEETSEPAGPTTAIVVGLLALAAIALAAVVLSRRNSRDPNGPAGQH